MSTFPFTYDYLKKQYLAAISSGYKIVTCKEYIELKKSTLPEKILVNRIDIDFSCTKAEKLTQLLNDLGIKATFFIRLHAEEYNPFSFENYRCLKFIRDSGHEIGYHSEIVDQANIWNEDAADCLVRDIAVLENMLNIKIDGVASHGGRTGLNNLDFWADKTPDDFNLLYEGYDKTEEFGLFDNSFYISDSNWTFWKSYNNGKVCIDDHRSPEEHFEDNHPVIYLLVHPDTYYIHHPYE